MTEMAAMFESADGATATTRVRSVTVDRAYVRGSKKRHMGLWFGIPGGLLVAGAAAASVLLIAPGVTAAGADFGLRPANVAADALASRIADTEITIDSGTTSVTLTGAELGLSVDEDAVAAAAHDASPLWNVTMWNSGNVPAPLSIDAETAIDSLRAAAPAAFTSPQNAGVEFDAGAAAYSVVDAVLGVGIDFDALSIALGDALRSGADEVTVAGEPSSVQPPITSADAQLEADALNSMLETAGFYVGSERAVALDPATVASWLTIDTANDEFEISADEAAIDEAVASLAEKVDREVVNEEIVTNSAGDHLRTVQEGHDGWMLGSTDGIAAAFAEQLESGNGVYELNPEVVPAKTTELFRTIEVDKSAGRAILYENNAVVATYAVAIGKPSTPTDEGHFTVYGQLTKQDMGCVPGYDYCTKNVPWVTYFNGDQGFHGTYWHNNFGAGAMMSHGCVNMTIAAAKAVYYFAQRGTEIWVHA